MIAFELNTVPTSQRTTPTPDTRPSVAWWTLNNRLSKEHYLSALSRSRNRPATTTTPMRAGLTTGQRRALSTSPTIRPTLPDERVSGMRKWEARVLEVEDGLATLELCDAASGEPPVLADFDMALFAPDSPEPGDVAYVTTRTVIGRFGQPHTTAAVRLRRLGRWTSPEVEALQERARDAHKRAAALFE